MALEVEKPVPLPLMTEDEFERWCDEDTRAEFVDGKVILMSPVSTLHEGVDGFLYSLLKLYLERGPRGRVMRDVQVRLRGGLRRVPDVLYVAPQHKHRIERTCIEGAPDAAFEIISPDSEHRDHHDKFADYEQAGVLEYWIINPYSQTVWIHRLNPHGRFEEADTEAEGLTSRVIPGFWLKPEWLWEDPTPDILDCLRELGVLS